MFVISLSITFKLLIQPTGPESRLGSDSVPCTNIHLDTVYLESAVTGQKTTSACNSGFGYATGTIIPQSKTTKKWVGHTSLILYRNVHLICAVKICRMTVYVKQLIFLYLDCGKSNPWIVGRWATAYLVNILSTTRRLHGYKVYREEMEEVEIEMEIGLPMDVKHVTHIGLDGSTMTDPLKGWHNLAMSMAIEILSFPSLSLRLSR
ncbi:hypothetical protein CRG98_042143 [Punica granatum]|uniref:CRIB domain-containing protein n=1 Tax=Punica granatum TaxID=22663 RepID=A0A2I0I0J2_PUNGR|nr:hypothetical protein CRG98_042143 [Punica granatum]